MTYNSLRLYVVVSKRNAAFYGIRIQTKESVATKSNDDEVENDNYRTDWLIVDKMQFVPCDFLSDDEFNKKYTIFEHSDMKLGGTLIQERCKKTVENFNEEIFKHCAPADEETDKIDNSPLHFFYESQAKKLLKKIERRPVHFKDYRSEFYVFPEDINVNYWPYDEKQHFPELEIIGPMFIIDKIDGKVTFDSRTRKAFLGYADEILLRERMKETQNFEVKTNITNDMCINAEETFKMFIDVYLRESEVYRRLQEAEKKERKQEVNQD